MKDIKIIKGSLTEQSDGEIVLRGIIDPESMPHLLVDTYQRESLVKKTKGGRAMVQAISDKVHFQDIELGMRGQKFSTKSDTYILHNPVYIIDGFQRISAMLDWIEGNAGKALPTSLGVKVHFETNRKSERDMFMLVNGSARRRVSPNIMLKNEAEEHPGLNALYKMSLSDHSFPLCGRVTWSQQGLKRELLTGMIYIRSVHALLHHRFMSKKKKEAGPSVKGGGGRAGTPGQLDEVAKKITTDKLCANANAFFGLVEDCWGIRSVTHHQKCTHLRGNFLMTLALVLGDHDNFWKGSTLVVPKEFKSRLRSFPLNDPEIMRLAGAGHMAIVIIYDVMVKHLNSRRRQGGRLVRMKD